MYFRNYADNNDDEVDTTPTSSSNNNNNSETSSSSQIATKHKNTPMQSLIEFNALQRNIETEKVRRNEG